MFPLNAYIDYVIANGENIDGVVTEMSFDEDDNQVVLFRAVDFVVSDPALRLVVDEAVESPDAQKAVVLTVAAVDKGEDSEEEFEEKPKKAQVVKQVEEEVAEPTKRATKKATPPTEPKGSLADVVSAWSDD